MAIGTTEPAAVLERIAELSAASWGLGALAAAMELGLVAALGAPRTAAALAEEAGVAEAAVGRLLDVVVAAGLATRDDGRYALARGLRDDATLRAELRSTLEQVHGLAAAAREGRVLTAWSTTDPVVLQAQGDMSAGAVDLLEHQVFPRLEGVLDRLAAPGAAFLDVGAGVCSVTIEFCRRWPHLRAVAVEPADAPAALAAANVTAAGLDDRIELRRQLVQDLTDTEAFDVVWLPGNFLPQSVLPEALRVTHRALRPGGWALTATLGGGGDDLPSAAARLRASTWGGDAPPPEHVEDLARSAGFAEVRRLPRLPSGLAPLVARRAPA